MADDEDIKKILQRYKLEQQINKSVKENTKNVSDYADAQKMIVENYKEIQQLNKQINDLLALGTKEAEEEAKILMAQRDTYIAINKELSKTKNLLKAVGGSIMDGAKALKNYFIPSLSDVFSKFLEIDNIAHQTANTLGFQGDRFKFMQDNLTITRDAFVDMGFSVESAYKAQTALSDATGRQVMLTKQASVAMAETARITGMEVEELAGMTGQMEAFGLGAEQSAKIVLEMSKESAQMGLNSGKVIKKFEQNLNLLNKLNFKNGVQGLKEMAKFSEKYKIDMQAVASVADKVFRPEGAIEAAAQLQVLGGDLAALGDPFTLMYKARNSPEELAKSLTKAATASATFNAKTGEFEVNANELDRLREAANALGMDYSHLVEVAKQGAKVGKFEGLLGGKGLDEDTMNALTGAAQMGEKGAFVTIKGSPKLLKDLTQGDIELFKKNKKERDELAAQAMSVQANFEAIKNKIMVALVEIFEKIPWDSVIPVMKKLGDAIVGFIGWFSQNPWVGLGSLLLLYFGPKVLWPIIQGKLFGWYASKSFSAGLKSNDLVNKLVNGVSKTTGGGQNAAQTLASGKADAARTAAGGQAARGAGMGSFMSSLGNAATILALGAALMMVAKSVDIFADAMIKMKGVGMAEVAAGLSFVVVGLTGLGVAAYFLTASGAPLVLLALGASMLMIGGAVWLAAQGMSVLVDSFTNMFKVIGPNGDSVMKAGAGFLMMAAGIGVLSFALVGLSTAALLGVVGLGMILGLTTALVATSDSLKSVGGGEGIAKAVNAINSVNTDKLDALKDLSMWMALLGSTTTIKFDETLKVSGSIEVKGEAGGRSSMDLVNNDSFVRALSTKLAKTKVESRNQKS